MSSAPKKYARPLNVSIKARLRQLNYANFLEYYHNGSAELDYFYKYLVNLANKHKLFVKDGDFSKFKSTYTKEGFYFKTTATIKCKNAIGRPCLLEDILDRDAVLKLKITPYDFDSEDGNQIIGISIQCIEANAKPDSL
jgi:hypothetical protein